ncbi:MAG TPA: MFS transporter [Thermodesulfobacteriota bacterium]
MSHNIAHQQANASLYSWMTRLVDVQPDELRSLIWSFLYFFSLLCSYYIIRPIRDEMGIAGGVENLHWLFTGTFLSMLAAVPLFGWIASKYPRKRFIPCVYYFFIANLLLFFFLFSTNLTHAYVARAFFIWVSVYNLFVVSVFWSFMADIYSDNQAKRLFGFIAAGGTTGAIVGPALTGNLVLLLGPKNLLPLSAILLLVSVVCIGRLISKKHESTSTVPGSFSKTEPNQAEDSDEKPMGGSIVAAFRLVLSSPYLMGICLLILLFTTLATFLYFQQAQIVRDSFDDPSRRTAVFAAIDFAVNILAVTIQVLLTGRIVKSIGLSWSLALIPVLLGLGFLMLGLVPLLMVLVIVQVVRRAGDYAIMKPSREMLFTVLNKQEKYKAKNFIDTAIYRGGDAVSAWIYAGLSGLGVSLSAIALAAVPISGIWAIVSYILGKKREELAGRSA